jgi:flagellar motor switch protein FliG
MNDQVVSVSVSPARVAEHLDYLRGIPGAEPLTPDQVDQAIAECEERLKGLVFAVSGMAEMVRRMASAAYAYETASALLSSLRLAKAVQKGRGE